MSEPHWWCIALTYIKQYRLGYRYGIKASLMVQVPTENSHKTSQIFSQIHLSHFRALVRFTQGFWNSEIQKMVAHQSLGPFGVRCSFEFLVRLETFTINTFSSLPKVLGKLYFDQIIRQNDACRIYWMTLTLREREGRGWMRFMNTPQQLLVLKWGDFT